MSELHINNIIGDVCPPLDNALVESLLLEFLDVERRYVLGDWEPATLNGGQFVEILARIVYHIDSGNLNRKKRLNDCVKYIESDNNSYQHNFPHRQSALHICKVIRIIYNFRSKRGAVHIDPDYSANELDSILVVSLVRWLMSELLRIFWKGDTKIVSSVIKEIVRYEVPSVLVLDNRNLVLHTGCSVEEEVLLLLHNAGETGLTRTELGKSIPKPPPRVTEAVRSLSSPSKRQIIQASGKAYVLTPNGAKRIHDELRDKLALQR